MKPLLINQSGERVPAAWLGRWLAGLARELKLKKKEIVLVFVKSAEMKRLNGHYRGKKYATDVLSFESAEEGVAGELVFCLSVIRSQSRRTGLSERGELGYMVVHGVLHLLGYDHENSRGEAEMFAMQDRVFAALERKVGFR